MKRRHAMSILGAAGLLTGGLLVATGGHAAAAEVNCPASTNYSNVASHPVVDRYAVVSGGPANRVITNYTVYKVGGLYVTVHGANVAQGIHDPNAFKCDNTSPPRPAGAHELVAGGGGGGGSTNPTGTTGSPPGNGGAQDPNRREGIVTVRIG